MPIKEVVIRKIIVGLLLFVLASAFFLLSCLLIGIELLFLFWIVICSAPILLFYAPLWSMLSEVFVNRINKEKKKDAITFLHMIGGFILPYILIAIFNPEEFIAFLGSSDSMYLTIPGIIFSIFYLLLDRWYLEKNK